MQSVRVGRDCGTALRLVAHGLAVTALSTAFACGDSASSPRSPKDAGVDAADADIADVESDQRFSADDGGNDADSADPDPPATDVHAVVTADNAYKFGWGDKNKVDTLNGSPPAIEAADIFACPIGKGPEAYVIPAAEAPVTAYLYIIAWADHSTTQGVIGQFEREGGDPIFTGNGNWEVCATGVEYVSPSPGPDVDEVNDEIANCNDASGSPDVSSAGWVGESGAITPDAVGSLVFGEDNRDPSGDFPLVCQVDASEVKGVAAEAKWMWYSPDGTNPFRYTGSGNTTRTFLIFRLPTKAVPNPPPTPK